MQSRYIHTKPTLSLVSPGSPELVNDVHSKLNATAVRQRVAVTSEADIIGALTRAKLHNLPICISGARHAMGGQQFNNGGMLLDMRSMKDVLSFDAVAGEIDVEAGITWPDLIAQLNGLQPDPKVGWCIAQKQTGCDTLTIGGALSANVHGRGLTMRPFIADVQSFRMVLPNGTIVDCSRDKNPDLFCLAIGGYGLFGIITTARIKLVRRRTLQRHVELATSDELFDLFADRIADNHMYGDFQFAIDASSPDFLHRGILSTYREIEYPMTPPTCARLLSQDDWRRLLMLAHTDKTKAFEQYSKHYLSTNGQVYQSDTFQLATYIDDYHTEVDAATKPCVPGSEIISELYVPRKRIGTFLKEAASILRQRQANVIYGTVRLIERDDESFLPWAKDDYACVVLNLHVDHSPQDVSKTAETFRALIDLAIALNGNFYLTYHRFATDDQVLQGHPNFPKFIQAKQQLDPGEVIQSDWYRHYKHLGV